MVRNRGKCQPAGSLNWLRNPVKSSAMSRFLTARFLSRESVLYVAPVLAPVTQDQTGKLPISVLVQVRQSAQRARVLSRQRWHDEKTQRSNAACTVHRHGTSAWSGSRCSVHGGCGHIIGEDMDMDMDMADIHVDTVSRDGHGPFSNM